VWLNLNIIRLFDEENKKASGLFFFSCSRRVRHNKEIKKEQQTSFINERITTSKACTNSAWSFKPPLISSLDATVINAACIRAK